jgi:hypothetical protein
MLFYLVLLPIIGIFIIQAYTSILKNTFISKNIPKNSLTGDLSNSLTGDLSNMVSYNRHKLILKNLSLFISILTLILSLII